MRSVDKRDVAKKAISRVNAARGLLVANRERWPELHGCLGINKRWLRAFASGQIQHPPADRFLAIESCLDNGWCRPAKKARASHRPG